MLAKLHQRLEKILVLMAGISIIALIVFTTADAAARYTFGGSIRGLYDLTEKYLMPLVFLGACYAYREGAYVRLTFVTDRLPKSAVTVLNYIVQSFCAAITLSYTVATTVQIFDSSVQRETINLGLVSAPLWTAFALVPLGGFFLFLAMFVDLWHIKDGQTGFFKEDTEELL